MAADRYADRAFVTINGFEIAEVRSSECVADENLTRADHCSRNYRSSGFKKGNKHVALTVELSVPALKAQIDLALADDDAEVNVVYECGGDRYTASDCAQSRMSMRGSVGDGSKTLNLEAIDLVNENGTSVNTTISLG